MTSAQLSLDLRTPSDHGDLLGNALEHTRRCIWTPSILPAWQTVSHDELRDVLAGYVEHPDVYITPNEFYSWRRVKNTAGLHALYVDIDDHSGNTPDPVRMAATAISRIEAAQLPEPNAIIYTGRGIHLYWLIERTAAAALPRWQACQRMLVKILDADRQSADVTRVLRVIGTINSKTGRRVTAELLHRKRYSFDWLADQILPLTREELREARVERAQVRDIRAAQAKAGTKRRVNGSIYQRWYLVYQDLWRIVQANDWVGGQGVTQGNRDRVLFHMANSLSWFTVASALDDEIAALARRIVPTLGEREALSYCKSVLGRARKDAEKGDGSRYKYKRMTLWNQLGDLVPESLLPELRAIVPDEVRAEREKERLRVRDGVKVDRATYLDNAEQRRATARLLKAQGVTWKTVGESMGISATAARLLASR